MKKINFIFILIMSILLFINIGVLIYFKFNNLAYYILTSSLFIIFPFISLFLILFLNIKKIDYKARKYDEASLISYIILGSLLLFVYAKLNNPNLVIFYILSIGIFIINSIIFAYLNFKKGEITKPSIIRKR